LAFEYFTAENHISAEDLKKAINNPGVDFEHLINEVTNGEKLTLPRFKVLMMGASALN